MIICPENSCTGCSACLNVCKQNAITMAIGTNGHLYPQVDEKKCINCGLCIRTCPSQNMQSFQIPIASFVATARDNNEALTSTSAGVASVLSRYIINEGGVVYGACGLDCQHVQHIRISSLEDVDKIKGSKYVQSAIGRILSLVRNDLDKGTKVLFIGTPCQVAGLRGFLQKEYSNLYTIDLVCHGVPSQSVLTDALRDYLPNADLSELKVDFRKKKKGKSLYGLFISDKTGKILFQSTFPNNEYIVGFLYGLYYRESCYQCIYAKPDRVSDITLGDYWDRENKISLSNSNNGLSMLIANTSRGLELLLKSDSLIDKIEAEYSDFIKRNRQLHHPITKHNSYELFLSEYPNNGFLKTTKKILSEDIRRLKKTLFRQWLSSKAHTVIDKLK